MADLLQAGATRVRDETYRDGAGAEMLGRVVMLDSEENEFSVA